MHNIGTRTATPLGSPLAAIEGLYNRALVAGKDFEVHDQFAYALTSVVQQWDKEISQQEHTDDETLANVWEAAWQSACHPFVITFGDGWTSLVSVPTLHMAWKAAEQEARSYGCNVRSVACTRRCWYCLIAEADYDKAARDVISARMAEHLEWAAAQPAPGLRPTIRIAHDGGEPRLSDSSVQPIHEDDAATGRHQQG